MESALYNFNAHAKSLFSGTEMARQGRLFGISDPIIYWVGWFVMAYVILYIITYYIAPFFFGPHHIGPMYPYTPHANVMNTFMHKKGSVGNMSERQATDLTARVTNARPF